MGKRKAKVKVLTKIDPSILKPKPQAISQHAADNGTRVTTAVKPTLRPPVLDPLLDPATFDADVSDFDNECLEDDGDNDDISRGYYVSRVRAFPPLSTFHTQRLITVRTTRSYYGRPSVTCFLRNSYDSKAEVYSPTAAVNSAAKTACTAALIVLQFSSSAQAV